MEWFNLFGLIFIVIIMIPNCIFAFKVNKEAPNYNNKLLEVFEQVGRYGCLLFMVINPPYVCHGFWFNFAELIYLLLNSAFTLLYIAGWIFIKSDRKKFEYLALSVLPSAIFVSSGIIQANYPLIVFSIIFAISHITISVNNSKK